MDTANSGLNPPPRILIISDVAVERSGAGSLLLYRLLRDYPPDRLMIFFNPKHAGDESIRLPGVDYRPLPYEIPRYLRNRLNPFWPVMLSWMMPRRAAEIARELGRFVPDIVLSVANGFLWLTAEAVARRCEVPNYLFLHEEWSNLVTGNKTGWVWDAVRAMARARVRPVYRRSSGRFSVSPGMDEEISRTYGLRTTVIYPNRGNDSPACRVRLRTDRTGPPVVAHAGFIHLAGNAALFREMAEILGGMGGHLDLYTTHTEAELAWHGLIPPVVRRVGFFPAAEMAERLEATADVLFLSASFDPADRVDVGTLFPSKLADYTAIGLPILVWGPEYSSAAQWATANPGATMLVTAPDPDLVRKAIVQATTDRLLAAGLAEKAVEVGKRYFDLSVAQDQFLRAITFGKLGDRR